MRPRTIRTVQMAMSVPWRSRSSRFRTFVPPPAPLVPLYVREMCSLAVVKDSVFRGPLSVGNVGRFFFRGMEVWMFDMYGEWWILHAKTGGMLQIEKGKVRFGSWNEKYVWDDENKKVNRAVKSPSLCWVPCLMAEIQHRQNHYSPPSGCRFFDTCNMFFCILITQSTVKENGGDLFSWKFADAHEPIECLGRNHNCEASPLEVFVQMWMDVNGRCPVTWHRAIGV